MRATFIGQSSVVFAGTHGALLVDPYFFDACADRYGPNFKRLRPPGMMPDELPHLDAVLITHEHDDHADPASVRAVAARFPGIRVIGPAPALDIVRGPDVRVQPVGDDRGWIEITRGIRVRPTASAHPSLEMLPDGGDRWCGFVIEVDSVRAWHAGDTSASDEVVASAKAARPLHVAFLPVNERNHARERMGIVGNMSPREALALADEVGVPWVIPIHWDLFACNGTSRAEVEAAHAACGSRAAISWLEPGEALTVERGAG
jgi:L-ascorbate metabolism protein UlaG (beta-lactamase superfamily)